VSLQYIRVMILLWLRWGQSCGDIELTDYLANREVPVPLVLDLLFSHDRFGSSPDLRWETWDQGDRPGRPCHPDTPAMSPWYQDFFFLLYFLVSSMTTLCPTVIDDVVHHPNSPSVPGLCVCERVSQLTSDRTYSSFESESIRDRPLPRFHLLQHVNAERDSIYCNTRQWKYYWLQNATRCVISKWFLLPCYQ
jgi:hypothetical protein